jgi:integrase
MNKPRSLTLVRVTPAPSTDLPIAPGTDLPINARRSESAAQREAESPTSASAERSQPCNVNRKVAPRRANAELRSREYLTPAEIARLSEAAKDGRWGLRDATLIMVAYRHGLRAKEAAELEWTQVEFGRNAALHVRRAKRGKPAVHPIRGDELRMLTALRRAEPSAQYVFTTERGTPFTADANAWRSVTGAKP